MILSLLFVRGKRLGINNYQNLSISIKLIVVSDGGIMKKEQKAVSQYLIVYVDKNNKINNIITDMNYNIDTRENMMQLISEINNATNGNYRALLNLIKICDLKPKGRKKKDESKTN